jgi:hypothetical protein
LPELWLEVPALRTQNAASFMKTRSKLGLAAGAAVLLLIAVVLMLRITEWVSGHRVRPESPPPTVEATLAHPEGHPADLSKHFNGTLDRSWVPGFEAGNNLESLPRGPQELGGVVFDVQGIVQLQGQIWQKQGHRFPQRVDGIRVGRACARVHLLHANSGFADPPGTTVALLVLHYADGTEEQLSINQGEHILDWWVWNNTLPSDLNTVVAWTGENPAVAQRGKKIRLLRTSFENPKPDLRLETIDYVSAMEGGAPFLVALTTE